MNLLSLTTIHIVEVTGRGKIHLVEAPLTFSHDENPLFKQEVMLDGRKVKIIGMERRGNTTRERDIIGIMVKEIL